MREKAIAALTLFFILLLMGNYDFTWAGNKGTISPPKEAAEGWILWERETGQPWSIIDGYSTYDMCARRREKILSDETQACNPPCYRTTDNSRDLIRPQVDEVDKKTYKITTEQFSCLPGDFHPNESD